MLVTTITVHVNLFGVWGLGFVRDYQPPEKMQKSNNSWIPQPLQIREEGTLE